MMWSSLTPGVLEMLLVKGSAQTVNAHSVGGVPPPPVTTDHTFTTKSHTSFPQALGSCLVPCWSPAGALRLHLSSGEVGV